MCNINENKVAEKMTAGPLYSYLQVVKLVVYEASVEGCYMSRLLVHFKCNPHNVF